MLRGSAERQSLKRHSQNTDAGVPEWSNGIGLGPIGLVPAKVRILSPA